MTACRPNQLFTPAKSIELSPKDSHQHHYLEHIRSRKYKHTLSTLLAATLALCLFWKRTHALPSETLSYQASLEIRHQSTNYWASSVKTEREKQQHIKLHLQLTRRCIGGAMYVHLHKRPVKLPRRPGDARWRWWVDRCNHKGRNPASGVTTHPLRPPRVAPQSVFAVMSSVTVRVIHRNQGLHLQLNESPGIMLWNAISCSVRTLTAMWLNTFPFTRLQKAHLHAALLALTYPHLVQVPSLIQFPSFRCQRL